MLRRFLRITILAGFFSFASLAATAQDVVNAMIGTVRYIDTASKTITITADDGTDAQFKDLINSKKSIEFDPNIRTDATAAGEFQKSGVRAIVYYIGSGDIRTVVALRSLGPGPFVNSSGTLVHFDKNERSITIKDHSGVMHTFQIDSNTVAETGLGAVAGLKLQAEKGDPIQIYAATVDGNTTALFINTVIVN